MQGIILCHWLKLHRERLDFNCFYLVSFFTSELCLLNFQELQIEKQKHDELLKKYTEECKSSEGKVHRCSIYFNSCPPLGIYIVVPPAPTRVLPYSPHSPYSFLRTPLKPPKYFIMTFKRQRRTLQQISIHYSFYTLVKFISSYKASWMWFEPDIKQRLQICTNK